MSDVISCPDPQSLEQFLLGSLPATDSAAVEQHLLQCPQCIETIGQFEVNDTVVDAIRARAAQMDKPDEPFVRDLINRMTKSHLTPLRFSEQPTQDAATIDSIDGDTTKPQDYDFLAPPQKDDELGRLGNYRVLRELGRGGMGIVFEAEEIELHRRVALKVMYPSQAASESSRKRFLREARATAALQHDNIVSIFQVGEDLGLPYLAMPLLEGQSLHDLLQSGQKLSLAQILRIGREIANGLAAAHDKGLIHRDIKPANLWIEPEHGGRIKIVDFGLARGIPPQDSKKPDETRITQAGMIIGTPAYMAPEQANAEKNVDHRTDLFSLGCVLYYVCTGQSPFSSPDLMSTLMAVATHEPPPPIKVNPEIPTALSDLVIQLLCKQAEGRPTSAREVADILEVIEQDNSVKLSSFSRSQNRLSAFHRMPPIVRWGIVTAAVLLLGFLGWFVAGQIIYVETPYGRLMIKTVDPDIKVIIRGEKVIIVDLKKQREIQLKVGKWEIELVEKKDGLRLLTKKFSITRDKKKIVEVIFEPWKIAQTNGDLLKLIELGRHELISVKRLDINLSKAHDVHPVVSSNGLTLLFQSDRPGGQGSTDLWECTRKTINESWSTPKNLGANINSSHADEDPKLSVDNLTLTF